MKTALSTLDTPEWLNDLWPKYVANLDVMTKYMESRSWGLGMVGRLETVFRKPAYLARGHYFRAARGDDVRFIQPRI